MTRIRLGDARVKVLLAVSALTVAIGANHLVAPLFLAAVALASYLAAGEPPRLLFRAAGGVASAAAVPVLLAGLFHGRATSAHWAARVTGACSVGFWLSATTTLADLQAALAWLGVPRLILEILGLAHRYVTVFRDTLQTAREAQALRLGYVGARRGLRSLGVLGGLVLRRAVDQTGALAEAMQMRGYRGQLWLPRPRALTAGDAVLAAIGGSVVVLAGVLAW